MKSKSELLTTLKTVSFTNKEESPSIENEIFSTLSYFKSSLNHESKNPSPSHLFHDDDEIIKYFKKILLQSMASQGSSTLDEIRLLSYDIFALLLENPDIAGVLIANDTNGKTFCALISLSVGELRIELGRILSSNSVKHRQILIIWYCSRIVQSIYKRVNLCCIYFD